MGGRVLVVRPVRARLALVTTEAMGLADRDYMRAPRRERRFSSFGFRPGVGIAIAVSLLVMLVLHALDLTPTITLPAPH